MKKKWMFVLSTLVMGTLLFTSCKKQDEVAPTKKGQKADDASARNELDRAQEDIEKVYNSDQYAGNQRGSAVVLPCGSVSINATNHNNFEIKYNGVNCGSRVLGGSIAVELVSGTKFSDAGAKLKITFNNYKVHYNASGEEIVYNGTTYTTNYTGGSLPSLFLGAGQVIHKTRGMLTLTYDTTGVGGSTFSRTWNLFRKKTFTSTGTSTGVSLKFEGDTTVALDTYLPGTYDAVSEYGTDVDNRKFIHTIPTPFLWSNCGTDYSGPYILKTGRVEHTAFSDDNLYKYQFTATAGYVTDGTNNILKQDCSSNGYLIEWAAYVMPSTTPFVKYAVFQQY